MNQKRGDVWLAVAGLVISSQGEWLVVKKKVRRLGRKLVPASGIC